MKNVWQWILSIFLVLTFISCGSSTDGGKIIQGTVYDDLIVGLNYQTKDYSSKTNNDGKFNYKSGEVKFYIGSLYIGKIPKLTEDKKVFLSDILGLKRGDYRSKELVKLATLLQSLDTTPPNDDKIVLDESKIKELFTSNQTLENLDLNKLNLTLPTAKDVKQRVRDTLVQQNITPIDNINPTAKAGEDQTKKEGQSVTLDASGSTDSDGSIVSYEWSENGVILSNEKSFTKNDFSVGEHTITLKVTDNEEATSSTSIVIAITAKGTTPMPTNKPPVANAGDDINKKQNEAVTLDASKSTDEDISSLKYEWFEGNNLLSTQKIFTKSDFSVGVHTITLKVTDNKDLSASDEVKVIITDGIAPVANITPANMATDVSLDSNVAIVFSKKVKGIDDKNITLTKAGSTIPLAYKLEKNYENIITLIPTNLFEFNTNYTIMIKNLEDNAGNVISPTTSTFTTLNLNQKVLKTGQTTSYMANDDGAYSKGVARSYTKTDIDSTLSIVKDNVTGLEWKNEYLEDMNWTQANEYCTNLTLNGQDDWRLPSILELGTITDFSKLNPGLDTKFNFLFTSNETYHSSTSFPKYDSFVRTFKAGVGNISYDRKKDKLKATCVRGEQMSSLKCYRDNSETIICSNGLTWQDDKNVTINKMTWSKAIEYCENLDFANYSDWRLPNINELRSIVDYHRLPSFNSSLKNIATGSNDKYWSSTTSVFGVDIHAWFVMFSLGKEFLHNKKDNENYVRCVR